MPKVKWAFLASFFILLGATWVSASTCTQIGNTTYCDGGTTYTQIGNTIYGPGGDTYTQIGNTTYGPNGSTYTQIGNTTYGPDGDTYTQIGNTVYGPGGSTYTQIGNTTYGSGGYGGVGGIFNTCPTHSSYDSLSGKCKCSYGYVVDGDSCVDGDTVCYRELGYNSSYSGLSNQCECDYGYVIQGGQCVRKSSGSSYSSGTDYTALYQALLQSQSTPTYSCPSNSHESLTDSTKCDCNSGYIVNPTRDKCIPAPSDNLEIPMGTYEGVESGGYFSCGGTTKFVTSTLCNQGYRPVCQDGGIRCAPVTATAVSNTANTIPETVTPPVADENFEVPSTDVDGFSKNAVLNSAAAFRQCPSTKCSIIRYYAETAEVTVTGQYSKGDWYQIRAANDAGDPITGWIHKSLVQIDNTDVPKENDSPFSFGMRPTPASTSASVAQESLVGKIWQAVLSWFR